MNVFNVNTHDDIRLRSVSQNTKVRRKKVLKKSIKHLNPKRKNIVSLLIFQVCIVGLNRMAKNIGNIDIRMIKENGHG